LYSRGGDSAEFWLEFLRELDREVGGLIDRHLITLHSRAIGYPEHLRTSEGFSGFLKSDNGKLRIRLDTNGLLLTMSNLRSNS